MPGEHYKTITPGGPYKTIMPGEHYESSKVEINNGIFLDTNFRNNNLKFIKSSACIIGYEPADLTVHLIPPRLSRDGPFFALEYEKKLL